MTGKVVLTATLLSVLLVAVGCAPRDAAECKEVTYDSGGAPVRAMLCHPAGEQADLPAVIYLHGGSAEAVPPGFPSGPEDAKPMPIGVYRDLAEEGFVALGIFYFSQIPAAEENPDKYIASAGDIVEFMPLWKEIINDGLAFLKSQPEVADDRIGLVGWSLGGRLALVCAAEVPEYKAVVVLSGKTVPTIDKLDAVADALPPVLILHGESDHQASVYEAYKVRDLLEEAGVPHELVVFPGGDHLWRDEQGEEESKRMVQFLKDNL